MWNWYTDTRTNWSCCSAEDKRILEEAYRADAKPDKAARRDIVKRVSLNEREVQVRPDLSAKSPISRRVWKGKNTSLTCGDF